jgi:hypothetical protein
MAFLRAQQKAAGYDFRSDAAGTLLAAVAAMAVVVGLRRRPRRGARLVSTLRGLY